MLNGRTPIIFANTRSGSMTGGDAPYGGKIPPFLSNMRYYTIQVEPTPRGIGIPKPILFAIKQKTAIAMARAHPLPTASVTLTGQSLDSTGAVLGFVTCTLFKVSYRVGADSLGSTVYTQIAQTTSDASGNYTFVVGFDGPYRVTFDLNGTPIRAGLTLNTLMGA